MCKYILNRLKPDSLTVNMPQYNYGWGINGKIFSDELKKILMLCNKKKITLNSPASRIIYALNKAAPVLRTCSTDMDTASVSITPDGRISYCTINFDKDLFNKKVLNVKSFNFRDLQRWFSRTPINDPICLNCLALGTCEGVCPMQSIKRNKDKKKLIHDPEKCRFFRDFTKWAILNS